MNPLTDFIFTVTWFTLLVFAIRSLIRGWTLMREVPPQGYIIEKKTVTKIPHPEMADVQHGDELLVVKFGGEEKKDPLLQSFSDRIQTLRDEEGTTDIEDDEDDDGDIVVRI
tara:strand:+ start:605 stop:940 length:336 start_codon:yes stop_codon:yes gene_type:complete